jgi:hypothetical protein
MSQSETEFMVRYMMGSTAFDEVLDKKLTGSEREEKLSSAAYYFERALESAMDLDSKQECHRRLGIALLYLHFRDPVEIAEAGLSKFPDLSRAVEELETSLALDAQVEEKMFAERDVASNVLLPLDTLWMYESIHVEKQAGPKKAIEYLEAKMRLLEPLGDVNLPGTCSMLHTHYMSYLESQADPSTYSFHKAEDWLDRAVNGETYEDVAKGTRFCAASIHYKKKAEEKKNLQEGLEQNILKAMAHFQEGLEAKTNRDFDKAIRELDESILCTTGDSFFMEVDPRAADVAMSAYFELAASILIKFDLLNKRNLTDEEFLWFGRATRCARREIELYDKFISGTDRANDKLDFYKKAKQLASMELRFLTYEDNEKTQTRNPAALHDIHLSSIGCLAEEENQDKEVRRKLIEHRVSEKLCVSCGKSLGVLDKLKGSRTHTSCS